MREKSEPIVTYTRDELNAMAARGEDKTDLKKAAARPLPDGSDPDDAVGEMDWAAAELTTPRRVTRRPR